jgi:hypothetical protein
MILHSPDGIASPDGIKGKVSHVSVRVFLRPSSMIQEMDPPTFDCWQLQVKGVFQLSLPKTPQIQNIRKFISYSMFPIFL